MTETHASLLNQKIKCASFDAAIYPHLSDLSDRLVKLSVAALSRSINTQVTPNGVALNMGDGKSTLTNLQDNSVFYWIVDALGMETILVSVNPVLGNPLCECFLGAEFEFATSPSSEDRPDAEMVRLFVEEFVPSLNGCSLQDPSDVSVDGFRISKSMSAVQEVLKGQNVSMLFSVSIGLKVGDHMERDLLAFHLPVENLERRGLLEFAKRADAGDSDRSQWSTDLYNGVFSGEIDLPVILSKFKSTVGDLSRLEVGQMLPLEENAQHALELMLPMEEEMVSVAKGRLGALKDNKAIKLTTELEVPDMGVAK